MRTLIHIILILIIPNIFVCCSRDDNLEDEILTLTGKTIAAPNNTPIANLVVSIKNSYNIICSTNSNSDGSFELKANIYDIDSSYKLYINDVVHGIQKEYEINGFGKMHYDYGDLIIYDSRNPYNLPTFQFNNYTYIVHPLLNEEYSYEDALNACSNLKDMNYNSWFLPTKDELSEYFKTCNDLGKVYPTGYYRISQPNTTVIIVYRLFIDNVFVRYGFEVKELPSDDKAHVLPMTKYK